MGARWPCFDHSREPREGGLSEFSDSLGRGVLGSSRHRETELNKGGGLPATSSSSLAPSLLPKCYEAGLARVTLRWYVLSCLKSSVGALRAKWMVCLPFDKGGTVAHSPSVSPS